MSAFRSEVFASTARCHASVHLVSALNSREAKVLARRRLAFSLSRSSRLACGPLPSKMARAAWCSRLQFWHSWPPDRLPVWHRGGVPSPNLMHLSALLSAIALLDKGRRDDGLCPRHLVAAVEVREAFRRRAQGHVGVCHQCTCRRAYACLPPLHCHEIHQPSIWRHPRSDPNPP